MIDFVIFSSESFMPRTQVCLDSIRQYYPERLATIHLCKIEANEKDGTYIQGLAKQRLLKVQELLENGSETVVLLGADCVLYDNLNCMKYMNGDIILTPHVLTFPKKNGAQLYKTGHANADCVLFRPKSLEIIYWLLEQDLVDDSSNGVFYEQTWLSALPFLQTEAKVAICKHPGLNFAYFNFHERTLTKIGNKYFIDDVTPLVMVQYSGYVNNQPDMISKYFPVFGSVSDEILDLFNDYQRRINK